MNVTTAFRPVRARSIRQEFLDDSLVLCDELGARVHILNRTAAAIWTMCDGTRDVEQISKGMAKLYGRRPATIRDDVVQMIDQLSHVGLVVLAEDAKVVSQQEAH